MGDLWLKIKFWAKVVLFGLLLIYVITFVAENSRIAVQPWIWVHKSPATTLLIVVLWAFIAGCIFTILVQTTLRTLWQMRQMRHRSRTDRLEREVADMKA